MRFVKYEALSCSMEIFYSSKKILNHFINEITFFRNINNSLIEIYVYNLKQ